jgi:ribosomal-protein-alanine N-acetyltransferase
MEESVKAGGREGFRFRVRRARADDIYIVMDINQRTLPENYWYGFFKYILDNWGEAFLVAESEDGRIIGYSMSRVEHTRDPVLLGLKTELEGDRSVLSKILDAMRSQLREERPVGHLVSIAVLPEYRRRGVGSALLSKTIDVMRNVYRVDAIYLEVRVSNEPAIRLYEKFGFRKARIWRGYYRDGEDAYIMVKRLAEEAPATS